MRFTNKFPYTNINNINLDWIIKRVKELGETVRSYANDIANAVALAEAAQDAADSVTGIAESAVATAQAAEATANAIAGTANSALSTAQAANTTAQAAETTANGIAGTANTALATAQAANATAQAANTTAQAAEESADNAETIAGTASANASNAVQTANTALATANAALVLASQVDSEALNEKAGKLVDTETGAVVSFIPDRTIEQDLLVSVAVEPVQAGSGDPSPNNVRPISGWNTVNIERRGANLASVSSGNNIVIGHAKKGVTYTFSFQNTGNVGFNLKKNNNTGDRVAYLDSTTNSRPSITFTADEDYDIFLNGFGVSGYIFADSVSHFQIEYGAGVSPYQPYTGNTYTIQLNQTVYGGTLDVDAGIMTVEWYCFSLRGQYTVNKHGVTSYDGYYVFLSENGLPRCASSRDGTVGMFSMFKLGTLGQNYNGFVGADTIQFRIDDGGTGADVKTWLESHPVDVCYPLAEPFTIALDPVQIAALVGQTNNVWSDAGNVTVEFAADLKWYIDKEIAELQALVLENGG